MWWKDNLLPWRLARRGGGFWWCGAARSIYIGSARLFPSTNNGQTASCGSTCPFVGGTRQVAWFSSKAFLHSVKSAPMLHCHTVPCAGHCRSRKDSSHHDSPEMAQQDLPPQNISIPPHHLRIQERLVAKRQSGSNGSRGGGGGGGNNRAQPAASPPSWSLDRGTMRQLVDAAEGLFTPCPQCHEQHRGSRDSHVSFLDVDDPYGRAYCHFCRPVGAGVRVVQVRRNTYHDVVMSYCGLSVPPMGHAAARVAVVRIGDLGKLYDISEIQQYVINNGKVIFLRARPQAPKPGGYTIPTCYYCHRALMEPSSRFCSMECKLNREEGLPPLTLAEIRAAGDNRRVKIPRRLAEQSSSAAHSDREGHSPDCNRKQKSQQQPQQPSCQQQQQLEEPQLWRRRDSSNAFSVGNGGGEEGGGSAAVSGQGPGAGAGAWEDDDGGVSVAVTAAVGGGSWLSSRLAPLTGMVDENSPSAAGAAAAGGTDIPNHRPPRVPQSYGNLHPPPAAALFMEASGRPQRLRQPPKRVSSPAPRIKSGASSAAPSYDSRLQLLAAIGCSDEPSQAAPQRHQPVRRMTTVRANSAPLDGRMPGSGGDGSGGDGSGGGDDAVTAAAGSAAAGERFPPLAPLSGRAVGALPAGIGEYLLSLVRAKYCRLAASAGGEAACDGALEAPEAAAAAAAPLPPRPAPASSLASAFAAAAAEVEAPPPPKPMELDGPEPAVLRPRAMRLLSAGSGPCNARPPLSAGCHSFAGLAPHPQREHTAVGAKRRCASIDLGDAAAAAVVAAAAASAAGGTTLGGGGGQPEVTSPLRRHDNRGAAGAAQAEDLAARMALLSPTRIARFNGFATSSGNAAAAAAAAAGSAAAALGVDPGLGPVVTLMSALLPVRREVAGGGHDSTSASAALSSTPEADGDVDAGAGGDVRRVKPRKSRPRQAAMS
ncbi:hypothetical protein VOLCADRAFT_88126 [Volvox carteri f. nagariensis]|uniref:PLATZ transcription factor-domain-containing protein n=1 Tax=Volvox carteri f. nagariensis TaxID=3068 RepID=D8TNC5_VOLCA|nr:uncharacterized protein VOLCADRAFT_88126 [Volvox carteri f. nagariensis]EFJ50820.1 hypothetical protein VOLCADRAFT_88126 [Volvox carteri f. nagariensis]|eukprot:XP_002947832.1 hypothetical protein VOLCADRAFT_88126 [Volvox carteri f. nagariensis]